MKKWLAIFFLAAIFGCIAALFWYNEWQYSLPTPIPRGYRDVPNGAYIDITGKFSLKKDHPVFLHFFNPECPCSRFNIQHFKAIAAKYQNRINFAIVVITNGKSYTQENIREKFGTALPVLFDTSLAAACGVYSTPQAVLLNKDHYLCYRGNYNRSRYCTDAKTSYAQIAIDSLLSNQPQQLFDLYALKAYGCSIGTCAGKDKPRSK